MTALALFVTGWAAIGCAVNIPAWFRLLYQPAASPRFMWIRLGMVLQAIGSGFGLFIRGSIIWTTHSLPPLAVFNIPMPGETVIVWVALLGVAETCFVWTSQIPTVPPMRHANWPWRFYLGGTALWTLIVLWWAA